MKYPTNKFGIALPTNEVIGKDIALPITAVANNGLPLTFDQEASQPTRFDIHHEEWFKKTTKNIIIITLHELANLQVALPRNEHEIIHQTYEPPQMPTPRQAMQRIDLARLRDESRATGEIGNIKLRNVTDAILARCQQKYNSLTDKDSW